jgi:hypothetical protein
MSPRKITLEGVENELNTLIERRAQSIGDANYHARLWAQSALSYNLAVARERREQWQAFHRDMCCIHSRIAQEHAQKAQELCAQAGGAGA